VKLEHLRTESRNCGLRIADCGLRIPWLQRPHFQKIRNPQSEIRN
jgi:hypothetical protein